MSNTPKVSIICPLYNAVRFLPSGIDSIKKQTFLDYEIVAVNDGSTDNTEEMLFELTKDISDKLVYKKQENGGGFAARNTGLDLARGEYIAFFDIDDLWEEHHLADCFKYLEENPDVDWVYAQNRIVDITTDKVLTENSFVDYRGNPRPVSRLETEDRGSLSVIRDPKAIVCQILDGIWCGQQFSLIRKKVWGNYRFSASYRNEGADQLSVIRSLNRGFVFAYINNIHGTYVVHDSNASAGARGASLEKYLRLRNALIRGFEEIQAEEKLSGDANCAIRKRIANEYFWNIGYNLFSARGMKREARESYLKGLKSWPYSFSMWKTFLLSYFR